MPTESRIVLTRQRTQWRERAQLQCHCRYRGHEKADGPKIAQGTGCRLLFFDIVRDEGVQDEGNKSTQSRLIVDLAEALVFDAVLMTWRRVQLQR